MKKRDQNQLPLDLHPPKPTCSLVYRPLSFLNGKEQTDKNRNVVVLKDRKAEKNQHEMTRLYSLIVARARHLFE